MQLTELFMSNPCAMIFLTSNNITRDFKLSIVNISLEINCDISNENSITYHFEITETCSKKPSLPPVISG